MIEPTEMNLNSAFDWIEYIQSNFGNNNSLFIIRNFKYGKSLVLINPYKNYGFQNYFGIYMNNDALEKEFYFQGCILSRENFIELMKEKYSEYIEWLLFNPEWL